MSREEGIDCDFERLDGYLFAPPGGSRRTLDEELRAAHRTGLEGVTRVGRAPIAFDTLPCLKFSDQAQFDPMKYLVGLAKAIETGGGRIYASTHATSIEGGENARVETQGGHTVRADAVVVWRRTRPSMTGWRCTPSRPLHDVRGRLESAQRRGDKGFLLGHP